MKIALFTDSFKPQVNGVTTSIIMLADGLRELGHEVFIIATDHKSIKEPEDHVIRLKGKNVPLKSLKGYQLVFHAKKYFKTIQDLNLDLIHVHTEFSIGRFGVYCGTNLNIPIVYTLHTMYEEYMHHVIRFGKKVLKKPYLSYVKKYITKFANASSGVIIPHEKVRELFIKYGITKELTVIPTGLDLNLFYSKNYDEKIVNSLKKQLNIENKFILLFVGRVAKEKSIDILINEYAKSKLLKETKFVIVGDGPYLEPLKKLVHELNLEDNFVFTGIIEWNKVGLYYQIGDCFVNCSTSETQGLTYIEALAASLPLIVKYDTNLDGLIEDGKNGLFFKEDSDFNSKLELLYNSKELQNQFKENAVSSVSHFSKEEYAKSVNDLYLKIKEKTN